MRSTDSSIGPFDDARTAFALYRWGTYLKQAQADIEASGYMVHRVPESPWLNVICARSENSLLCQREGGSAEMGDDSFAIEVKGISGCVATLEMAYRKDMLKARLLDGKTVRSFLVQVNGRRLSQGFGRLAHLKHDLVEAGEFTAEQLDAMHPRLVRLAWFRVRILIPGSIDLLWYGYADVNHKHKVVAYRDGTGPGTGLLAAWHLMKGRTK